ncbi:glycosyltransferase family 39 protein [Streptomyces sp. NPDC051020]|uniref:glycosyltransferase family 39 protein n=1 Tax=Streptomyces sp. NPDC051020 TaxID=3155409 RepID=UPI0034265BD4
MKSAPVALRRPFLIWLIPVVWTVAFGLWGLSRQDSVWRDEAATWQVAQRSTEDIARMLEHVDVVHSLYYLFMHALFECFGPSTTVLRLPSVLAVAVGAACVSLIGHRLAGTCVGLGGGLVFGMLPAVQFYLQEGRPYALVAAGAGISTLLLVTALQGRDRRRYWIAYGCTVLICGYLNWLALLILPAHLTTLVWTRAPRQVRVRWAAASAAATAGVLPLILFSMGQSAQVSWVPPLTWHMLIGPAVLLAIGGLGSLVDRRAGRLSVAAVGLPLLAVPQIGLIGLSLFKPLFVDRYILFSLLGLALLIGTVVREVARRSRKASGWVLPVMIAVAVISLLPQSLAKRSPASRVDDVLAAAEQTRRLKQDGDGVLFIPAARRDTMLVSPDAFTGLQDIALAETPEESGTLKGVEASPSQVRTAMLAQRRILLVTDATQVARLTKGERDRTKIEVLSTYFTLVSDEQVRGRRVAVYEHLEPAP